MKKAMILTLSTFSASRHYIDGCPNFQLFHNPPLHPRPTSKRTIAVAAVASVILNLRTGLVAVRCELTRLKEQAAVVTAWQRVQAHERDDHVRARAIRNVLLGRRVSYYLFLQRMWRVFGIPHGFLWIRCCTSLLYLTALCGSVCVSFSLMYGCLYYCVFLVPTLRCLCVCVSVGLSVYVYACLGACPCH